jgi:hypothetical protein
MCFDKQNADCGLVEQTMVSCRLLLRRPRRWQTTNGDGLPHVSRTKHFLLVLVLLTLPASIPAQPGPTLSSSVQQKETTPEYTLPPDKLQKAVE